MRALQGSFPRFKYRFSFELRGDRRLTLISVILLFNFRTSLIGINQLLTAYIPELNSECTDIFHLDS